MQLSCKQWRRNSEGDTEIRKNGGMGKDRRWRSYIVNLKIQILLSWYIYRYKYSRYIDILDIDILDTHIHMARGCISDTTPLRYGWV